MHPVLFGSQAPAAASLRPWPCYLHPAQDANTRSLKLLHEYLDEAKTGPRVPLPYRFHFYIRSASASAAGTGAAASEAAGVAAGVQAGQQASAGAAAPAGLRAVSVTLPPPTRGAPGEPMSATTRKAFGSLLAAMGLPPAFGAGSEAEQAAAAAEYNRFVSLREFLPAAVETALQHAASQVGRAGPAEAGGLGSCRRAMLGACCAQIAGQTVASHVVPTLSPARTAAPAACRPRLSNAWERCAQRCGWGATSPSALESLPLLAVWAHSCRWCSAWWPQSTACPPVLTWRG